MTAATRLRACGLALALVPLGASPLNAQSLPSFQAVRSPGFGGGGVFLSPHAATRLGRFGMRGELEIAWGEAKAGEATASMTTSLPGALQLTGGWTGSSATAASAHRSDQSLNVTLQRGAAAIGVARRRSRAAFDDYTSDIDGIDARLGISIGTTLRLGLGLTGRSSSVVHRGNLRSPRRIIVAGYEFFSVQRLQFIEASRHRDVELDVSGAVAGFHLSGFVGRGFSDHSAPSRTWAWARLTRPIDRRLEILAEAGRNSGVPAIGRLPRNFARLGLRVNLTSSGPTVPPAPSRNVESAPVAAVEPGDEGLRLVLHSQTAATIEVKGNFTAWLAVPMRRLADGRWVIPVKEGVLHFNIRLDGRDWTVPAGVPVVPDEFFGAPVAVVVATR